MAVSLALLISGVAVVAVLYMHHGHHALRASVPGITAG